jgi:benzoylformate decarboxylase
VLRDESITAVGDVTRNFHQEKPHDGYAGRGGGIGQGLAGAPGVAVAHPGRQVVCVSGDGSAMYSIQALWTAAHHNLNIIFVILSNREYRVLKHNVDQYRSRFDVPSNSPYPHMDLSGPVMSFTAMAEGMGVSGEQVSTPEGIKEAVARALATDGPYLIDLVVEGLETR